MPLTQSSIISQARAITGNKLSQAVGELGIPDEALTLAINTAARVLSKALALTSGRKEQVFTLTPGQQDYPFSSIASDIKSVENVVRQAASEACGCSPLDCCHDQILGCGLPHIDMGFQQDVADVIRGQRLADRMSQFDWTVVGATLRLMPTPQSAEVCVVEYQSTGGSLADLPDDAEPGLVYAVVVAILDAQANRIMSDRLTGKTVSDMGGNPIVSQERLSMVTKQRDHYQQLFDRERDLLSQK